MERIVEYNAEGSWQEQWINALTNTVSEGAACGSVLTGLQDTPPEAEKPEQKIAHLESVIGTAKAIGQRLRTSVENLTKLKDTQKDAKKIAVRVITMHPDDDNDRRLLHRHTVCVKELEELREQYAKSEDDKERNAILDRILDIQIEADRRAREVITKRVTLPEGEGDLWSICNERNKLADRLLDAVWGYPASG